MATEAGLSSAFQSARAALITYLMAGYPDRATSLEALRVVSEAGADLIELGVPYTDQLADGPVIVRASSAARAAAAGRFGLAETLDLAEEFAHSLPSGRGDDGGPSLPPVALMTYLNPLLKAGFAEAASAMASAGISGAIVPDLPADSPMAAKWGEHAARHGIDTVFLVAPTSTDHRIGISAGASRGFVYCVSSVGITGERARIREDLSDLVVRVQNAAAKTPVAVGFGISTPEQASEIARFADGVVVGSAVVRRQDDLSELERFVGRLSRSVHDVQKKLPGL